MVTSPDLPKKLRRAGADRVNDGEGAAERSVVVPISSSVDYDGRTPGRSSRSAKSGEPRILGPVRPGTVQLEI